MFAAASIELLSKVTSGKRSDVHHWFDTAIYSICPFMTLRSVSVYLAGVSESGPTLRDQILLGRDECGKSDQISDIKPVSQHEAHSQSTRYKGMNVKG